MRKLFYGFLGVYFLCFQFVLIAYIWQDPRFYVLAGANGLAFLAICLFARVLDKKTQEKDISDLQESVAPVAEAVSSSQAHKRGVNPYVYFNKHDKKSHHSFFRKIFSLASLAFLASLVVALFLFTVLPVQLLSFQILLSVLLGLVFFFVAWLVLRFVPRFFSLAAVKFYLVLLSGSLLLLLAQLFFYNTSEDLSQDVQSLLSLSGKNDVVDPTFWTGNGEVISALTSAILEEPSTTGALLTGQLTSGSVDSFVQEESTGTILGDAELTQNFDKTALLKKLGLSSTSSLTMMDAMIYLIDSNDISLLSKKDVKFTYVTTKNPYYAYWRTAYAKRIIGVSTNPSTKLSCDSYFVFKGMLEGRDVTYTPATVKTAFWKEAQKKDILNGCVRGALMKAKNL